jgi:hypothetical protein
MSPARQLQTIHGWGTYDAHVGDVNKDGRADLIWNSVRSSSPNRSYAGTFGSDGATLTLRPAYDHSTSCCWLGYQRVMGDVTGDGAIDLIFSSAISGGKAIHGVRSSGTGGWIQLPLVSMPLATGNFTAFSIDLNGDGIRDLVWNQLTGSANRVHTALGKTSGSVEPTLAGQTHPATTTWSQASPMVGDVNGDQREDMVWTIPGSTVTSYVGLARP